MRWASYNEHIEVVKYLVENDANIKAVDDLALILVIEYGHIEVIKSLP